MLRNLTSLGARQRVRLEDVLQANQPLMTTYVMKEELKALWTAPDAWEWRRRWRQWLEHALDSGIEALQRFAQQLRPYWRGILSRVRWPMHTGQLEGINNRLKVISISSFSWSVHPGAGHSARDPDSGARSLADCPWSTAATAQAQQAHSAFATNRRGNPIAPPP